MKAMISGDTASLQKFRNLPGDPFLLKELEKEDENPGLSRLI